jgi:hypothetical protein
MTIPGIDPIDEFEFDGQLGGSSRLVAAILEQLRLAGVSETTEELTLWVDGTSGDDENDGLTEDTALKTLEAAWAFVPFLLLHKVTLNLRGAISGSGNLFLGGRFLGADFDIGTTSNLVVDGGTDEQIHDDNGGANYTATSGSATSIGDTGSGIGSLKGYVIEVLTGAAAGDKRLGVIATDADTLVPHKDFSAVIGVGDTFRFVKPATTISGYSSVEFGGFSGRHALAITNLFFSGTGFILRPAGGITISVGGCLIDKAAADALSIDTAAIGSMLLWSLTSILYGGSASSYGVALPAGGINVKQAGSMLLWECFADTLTAEQAAMTCNRGTQFADGALVGGRSSDQTTAELNNRFFLHTAGYAPTGSDGASGAGLRVMGGSRISIGAGCSFANAGSHGIEVDEGSQVELDGAVAGAGNTASGVYIHNKASLLIDGAAAPTITGNSGTVDLSFDGSTQKAAWATVAATPQVETTNDLLLAKAR